MGPRSDERADGPRHRVIQPTARDEGRRDARWEPLAGRLSAVTLLVLAVFVSGTAVTRPAARATSVGGSGDAAHFPLGKLSHVSPPCSSPGAASDSKPITWSALNKTDRMRRWSRRERWCRPRESLLAGPPRRNVMTASQRITLTQQEVGAGAQSSSYLPRRCARLFLDFSGVRRNPCSILTEFALMGVIFRCAVPGGSAKRRSRLFRSGALAILSRSWTRQLLARFDQRHVQ